ncbi:MAG: glycosyltransferase family 4 protein [Candidatus Hodarchaeota archaeon]
MNILMLTESNFPQDTRVRLEAKTLIEHGFQVSVIAIKDEGQFLFEKIDGVKIYRVPKLGLLKYGKQQKASKLLLGGKIPNLLRSFIKYAAEYVYFTISCFFLSFLILVKDKFDIIHTHNPPDTLFLVALFFKSFRKQFIYDHHDLCPELFLDKYKSGGKHIYKTLLFLEKMSCQLADFIISSNESYKKIEIQRNHVKPENIFVLRYGPDLNEMKIAKPRREIKSNKHTILCYLGQINIQDGVDYLLDTLAKIVHKHKMKDILLMIIGDGDYLFKIKQLANEMSLNEYIFFTGYISDRQELNEYLSTADIFVDAAPYSFLNNNSTFVKHMEYMIYGKPIVSFALKESMISLKDAGVFVPPNDTDKMAETIIELISDGKRVKALGANARKRVKELSWDKVSKPLIEAYEKARKRGDSQ